MSGEREPVSLTNMISLWIVEDDQHFREALCALMDGSHGIECEESFSNCEDALKKFKNEDAPEVVLMDIQLPGIDGIECVKRMKAISPATDIIMLTNHEEDDSVFRAICAGADGYLLKNSSLEQTISSIRSVLDGGPPMNPIIARKVLYLFNKFAAPKDDYGLTEREKGLLQLASEGHTKKTMADKLFIAHRTVDTHFKNIYKKLNVHTMGEAVRKWLESNPSSKWLT
jgi:DNA-binding NarL/FixJ family response regulator